MQVVESDLRVRELKSQIAMKETEHVAAVAVAASIMRKADAPKFQNAKLDFEMIHIRSDIVKDKQLRAKVARLNRNAERVTASLTKTANMCGEAVERAKSLSAQLAASNGHKDAYKSELTAIKKVLVIACVERASLRGSLNNLVAKVRGRLLILLAHFRRWLRVRIVCPRTLMTKLRQKWARRQRGCCLRST